MGKEEGDGRNMVNQNLIDVIKVILVEFSLV